MMVSREGMIEMKRQYGRTLSGWDMALRVIVGVTLEIDASAQGQVMQAIPQGQQLQLDPNVLRVWLGAALWFAANNSHPSQAGPVGEPE